MLHALKKSLVNPIKASLVGDMSHYCEQHCADPRSGGRMTTEGRAYAVARFPKPAQSFGPLKRIKAAVRKLGEYDIQQDR